MTRRLTALDVVAGVDLSGKACVITGASSGLGRESARALAAAGANVLLAARDRAALAETQAWIRAEFPSAHTSVVDLDLTSLTSVRAAAAAIQAITPAVHVLMNNAGVMFTPLLRSADGFEIQLATNHLGHFELTRLLTPALVAADGARVVILSSGGHTLGDISFEDPNWEQRDYDKFVAYGASKTANILHMVELDRRLQDHGIRAYAVCPGAVATSLARYMSSADFSTLRKRAGGAIIDFTSAAVGAATQVWAATSADVAEVGSVYLEDCQISDNVAPYAIDQQRAVQLWALSERMCVAAPSLHSNADTYKYAEIG
jgi:NAD(P)-dependent dehydrogenase (short-subunit alcohol dehydrogenase family)